MKTARKFRFSLSFLIYCWITALSLSAQQDVQNFAENFWHEGKILTVEGDTLYGLIKYDLQNNVVQLEVNKTVQTLTSRKALYFQLYDAQANIYRNYYALPYAIQNPNYEVPIFFELLTQNDPITLLCRERIITESIPVNDIYSMTTSVITRTSIEYKFFFLYVIQKNNEISIKIKTFSKDEELLALMSDWRTLMEKFIKENKLSIRDKYDMIDIVSYYNSLKAKNGTDNSEQ